MPLESDRTRIARDLLGWSAERLASFAGVSPTAIETLERTGLVRAAVEQRLRAALEHAGIEFHSGPSVLGPGVRFRPLRYGSRPLGKAGRARLLGPGYGGIAHPMNAAAVRVRDDQPDPTQAARDQALQERRPEGLGFTGSNVQADDLVRHPQLEPE